MVDRRVHVKIVACLMLLALLAVAVPGVAVAEPIDISRGLGNTVNADTVAKILVRIAIVIGSLGGAVSLIFFIKGAIQFMAAGGERSAAEAKQQMKNAVIGLVLTGAATTIISFIAYLIRTNVS